MPAIDKDLLAILICPESQQSLAEAGPDLLGRVNDLVRKGGLANKGGVEVKEPLEAGLVRSDGRVLYPVRSGIPVLLVEEGLPLPAGLAPAKSA